MIMGGGGCRRYWYTITWYLSGKTGKIYQDFPIHTNTIYNTNNATRDKEKGNDNKNEVMNTNVVK